MSKLFEEFTPNVVFDFGNGVTKTNKLSETFIRVTTDGGTDVVYDYIDDDDIRPTKYKCPIRCFEMDAQQGLNIKVDAYNLFDAKSYLQNQEKEEDKVGDPIIYGNLWPDEGPIAGIVSVASDYRPQLICMPMFAPIIYGENTIAESKGVIDGTKSTIIVEANREYNHIMSEFMESDGELSEEHENVYKRTLVLCADPRVFMPQSYKGTKDSIGYVDANFMPEGYIDDVESEANSNEELLPHARKGFFVINGVLTKFIVLSVGSIVKLTSYTTQVKTSNGYEDVILWNVDNTADFEEIEGEVWVGGYWYFDTQEKKLAYGGWRATFGKIDDGYQSKSTIFVSKRLGAFYKHITKLPYNDVPKCFKVKIFLFSSLRGNWEDSVSGVDVSVYEENN